ncbi:restriction endonuclease subunit S [Vibrio parahaemolyticus]|nr:restriction endonuclease subunit S [Vibrio parahaemolyticus]MBE4018909.1 type I restriction endonuclease subunit S [Vibrio parahaemolyticus]HCG6546586.1 restriction endonuclease subunit S [Vibrio parahaemolyticus]HCH3768643.1 restriction endonuclease subunit S [Vibrio parahaemolyticus]
MSELPKGWVELPLEHVASWGSGGTPKRSEPSYYGGDVPWVKTGDLGPRYLKEASEYISQLGLEKSSAKLFPKGSVAIAMYGATIGKTSTLDFEASTNQACAVGNPIDGVILTDFLYYFLTSEKQNFIKKGKGGAQPNISQQLIKAHEIQLPSLAEQKRIVEKLDEVLAQVDTIKARLDGIPELLKRFRQSVLASAVSGKLTEEWRGGAKFDVIESMLVELAKFIDYRGKTPKKTDSGVPLITAKNIKPGYISRTPEEFIAEDDYDGWMTRGFPKVGDILMTTEAPLGNVALIDIEEKFALAQRAICLQFTDERVKSEYACIYMRSMSFQEALLSNATGSTVKGIKASLLKKIVISYPEKEEQKEIVRLVDQYFAFADTIEAQVKKAQARVDNLTQSILAKAFRGELVEQDPNDEPADKLLERIAQARKEAEALAKAAKKAQSTKSTVKKKVAKSA